MRSVLEGHTIGNRRNGRQQVDHLAGDGAHNAGVGEIGSAPLARPRPVLDDDIGVPADQMLAGRSRLLTRSQLLLARHRPPLRPLPAGLHPIPRRPSTGAANSLWSPQPQSLPKPRPDRPQPRSQPAATRGRPAAPPLRPAASAPTPSPHATAPATKAHPGSRLYHHTRAQW